MPSDASDDPVTRNRAVHPRKGYDREALGARFTRRWGRAMITILLAATALLVVLLLMAN